MGKAQVNTEPFWPMVSPETAGEGWPIPAKATCAGRVSVTWMLDAADPMTDSWIWYPTLSPGWAVFSEAIFWIWIPGVGVGVLVGVFVTVGV